MTGGRQCNGVIMFEISRKTRVDNKSERINELEKINADYKKLVADLEIRVKHVEDKLAVHIKNLREFERRARETKEEYGRIKKQQVAENKFLLRRYKKLESRARVLERKMDREFVRKEKPGPSPMWRLMAIKDKILDVIR